MVTGGVALRMPGELRNLSVCMYYCTRKGPPPRPQRAVRDAGEALQSQDANAFVYAEGCKNGDRESTHCVLDTLMKSVGAPLYKSQMKHLGVLDQEFDIIQTMRAVVGLFLPPPAVLVEHRKLRVESKVEPLCMCACQLFS